MSKNNIYLSKTDPYDREVSKLQAWDGSETNKKIIRKYCQHKFINGCKSQRVAKISWQARTVCEYIRKDLNALKIEDLQAYIEYVNRHHKYTDSTKADYRRWIKEFYKWFKEEDERLNCDDKEVREEAIRFYRYVEKNVKRHDKLIDIDYSSIITDEDCSLVMSQGARTILEKTIIVTLHESGARIEEFLGLSIKDIEFNQDYAVISVDGKTGRRRIPLLKAMPWILRWIDEHPEKNNPKARLWMSKSNKFSGKPLRYPGIKIILNKSFKRASLNKKCNPHWFRHSRATIWASEYTEQLLCKIMGWAIGSEQVRRYTHIGAKQVIDAFKTNNGLAQTEQKAPKIRSCVCGTPNDTDARYCFKCGKPLTVGIVLEDDDLKKAAIDEAFKKLTEIMSNPELLKKLQEYKKTMEEK